MLAFFCTGVEFGQEKKADSLNAIIKNAAHDTTRARAYMSLSQVLYASDPDKIIPLSDAAIAICNAKLPTANAAEKRSYLYTKATALSNIGYILFNRGQPDSAMRYFLNGLQLQKETGEQKEIANSLNNIAAIYYKLGEPGKALDYFQLGLEIQEKTGVKEGIAYSLNNIGAIYDLQGQTKTALNYYFRGLQVQEEVKSKIGIGTSLNNIAAIFLKQGEQAKAFEYYEKSLKVREEAGDKRGIAQCLNNIAQIYVTKKEFEKALQNYDKSFALYTEIGNKQGIAYVLNNKAFLFRSEGNAAKALEYYSESLKIYESTSDKKGMATVLNNFGVILLQQKKAGEAKHYSLRSLEIAKQAGFAEGARDAHSALSKIDSALGKPADALDHYKQYILLRDSITNEDTRKAGIKKQFQYEYEKKEEAAKLGQEKKAVIQAEALKRQKIINWSAIGSCILLLISGFLFFNRFRLKQKNKHQQQLTQKQKEQAVAVMETQEQERKRIAEDLHDSLGHLLSTAKLNLQTVPQGQTPVENSLQLINQASEEIRNITFNLMPRALEEEGLVSALNELALKITNSGQVKVQLHVHDFDRFNLEKQSEFNIYRIVQEAVNNILKHADAKEINIQLIGQDDHLTIMIEDDGKGFDTQSKKSGRGLKNIVTRSLWLNGSINIDSSPGRGTTITTEIPT
jgi:two-component system, NarL family, sensor kinase